MASIGEELKRERELRGISLKEIADTTKISMRLLEALEKDQLDILPGKFFNKAIISSYAKYIGLDEDYVLNKYYEISLFQKQTQEIERKKRKPAQIIPNNIKKLINISILIILFLIFLSFIYLIFQKNETSPPLEKPEPPVLLQKEKPASLPVTESLTDEAEEKGINLEITVLDETWIQVYADGKIQINGLKYPGEKAKVKALNELLINLGNAGGISFTLNSKKGKQFGSPGAVVKNVRITTENYTQFLDQEEETENDT